MSASAKADLERARDSAPDPSLRHQAEIWLSIADCQPDRAAAGGAAAAAGWRLAALDIFARNGTPDATLGNPLFLMLRLANDDATGTLDTKQTEAYFYVGKYYQLKRDEARAHIALRQSLDRGMLDNLYYLAARHELERTR